MIINKENGLFYNGGDEKKYKDVLQDFYDSSVLGQKRLESALYDMKKYEMCTHSLKGIAKSIGAEELARVAEEHEECAKAGKVGYINDNMNEIIEVWEETLSDIEIMLGKENISSIIGVESNGTKLSHEELKDRVSEVLSCLKVYDSDGAHSRLKKLLEYELSNDEHQIILQAFEHIRDFEYEDTVDVLNKI